jgi:hypothetical protein
MQVYDIVFLPDDESVRLVPLMRQSDFVRMPFTPAVGSGTPGVVGATVPPAGKQNPQTPTGTPKKDI